MCFAASSLWGDATVLAMFVRSEDETGRRGEETEGPNEGGCNQYVAQTQTRTRISDRLWLCCTASNFEGGGRCVCRGATKESCGLLSTARFILKTEIRVSGFAYPGFIPGYGEALMRESDFVRDCIRMRESILGD